MTRTPWVLLITSLLANGWLLRKVLTPVQATPAREATADAQPEKGTPKQTLFGGWRSPAARKESAAPAHENAAQKMRPAVVDEELEADVLCTFAENHLFDEWKRDRDRTTANLKRSLADRDEQERNIVQVAGELADVLALDSDSRATLLARYRERRTARVLEAQTALDRAPPDYGAVAETVRGLFADEDELAARFGGDAGRERVRAARLEGRTSFLAIAAALGDAPASSVKW